MLCVHEIPFQVWSASYLCVCYKTQMTVLTANIQLFYQKAFTSVLSILSSGDRTARDSKCDGVVDLKLVL